MCNVGKFLQSPGMKIMGKIQEASINLTDRGLRGVGLGSVADVMTPIARKEPGVNFLTRGNTKRVQEQHDALRYGFDYIPGLKKGGALSAAQFAAKAEGKPYKAGQTGGVGTGT